MQPVEVSTSPSASAATSSGFGTPRKTLSPNLVCETSSLVPVALTTDPTREVERAEEGGERWVESGVGASTSGTTAASRLFTSFVG